MLNHKRLFFFIFFLSFLSPVLDFPLYLAQIDIVGVSKLPLLSLFLLAVVFHLRHALKISSESVLFALGGAVSLVVGFAEGQFTRSAFFTHFYAALMPIFAMSYGRYFCVSCGGELRRCFYRLMEKIFYLQLVILLFYFYFYYIEGSWSYFGFGTGVGLGALYMLSARRTLLFSIGFMFDLLSGKRSGVIAVAAVIAWSVLNRRGNQRWIIGASSLALFFAAVSLQRSEMLGDIFRRFELISQLTFDDAETLFIATGGRFSEVASIIGFLEEEPYRWIVGSGMGAQYLFFDPREGFEPELFHYAHFSPFGYVFLFGVPFTVVFYCLLISRVYSGRFLIGDFFYLGFLFFIATSFFGSNLFIDPRIWIFYGFVIQLIIQNKSQRATP
jgi:hypothetical protein